MKIAPKHITIDAFFFFLRQTTSTPFPVINERNHRAYEHSSVVTLASPTNTLRRKITIDNCYSSLSFFFPLCFIADNFVVRREKESESPKTRNTPRDIARERFAFEKSFRRTSPGV